MNGNQPSVCLFYTSPRKEKFRFRIRFSYEKNTHAVETDFEVQFTTRTNILK